MRSLVGDIDDSSSMMTSVHVVRVKGRFRATGDGLEGGGRGRRASGSRRDGVADVVGGRSKEALNECTDSTYVDGHLPGRCAMQPIYDAPRRDEAQADRG